MQNLPIETPQFFSSPGIFINFHSAFFKSLEKWLLNLLVHNLRTPMRSSSQHLPQVVFCKVHRFSPITCFKSFVSLALPPSCYSALRGSTYAHSRTYLLPCLLRFMKFAASFRGEELTCCMTMIRLLRHVHVTSWSQSIALADENVNSVAIGTKVNSSFVFDFRFRCRRCSTVKVSMLGNWPPS